MIKLALALIAALAVCGCASTQSSPEALALYNRAEAEITFWQAKVGAAQIVLAQAKAMGADTAAADKLVAEAKAGLVVAQMGAMILQPVEFTPAPNAPATQPSK